MRTTERIAALHTETLAGYRQNRHRIRAVEIVSDCCPTCALDSDRAFSLDAAPALPHTCCTHPDGCQCHYAPVPLEAAPTTTATPTTTAVPGTVFPVVFPPPGAIAPPPGLPAYLRTPTAAMIAVGAVVLASGIGLIHSTSRDTGSGSVRRGKTPPTPTVTVMATRTGTGTGGGMRPRQSAPVTRATQATTTQTAPENAGTRTLSVPLPRPLVALPRDREMEARAARDLRAADAIATENAGARRAQAVAALQQTYLQTLVSRYRGQGGGGPVSGPGFRVVRTGQGGTESAALVSAAARTATTGPVPN